MGDLTDEERNAAAVALRKLIAEGGFPHSPRLASLRSALAKLDPSSVPSPYRPSSRSLRLLLAAAAGGGRGGNLSLSYLISA